MKQIYKFGLATLVLGSAGTYYLSREGDINLNIYPTFYNHLSQYKLGWAVKITKFLLKNDMLFKLELNQNETKPLLNTTIKNPIGLASGYDVEGDMIEGLQNLGFGFIEIGSVTPSAQFREPKDRIIQKGELIHYVREHQTFGVLKCKANLISLKARQQQKVPIGISIIPSAKTIHYAPYTVIEDLTNCYREIAPLADYVVVNLIGSDEIKKQYLDSMLNEKDFMQRLVSTLRNVTKDEKNTSHQLLFKIDSSLEQNLINQILSTNIDGIVLQKNANQQEQDYLNLVKQLSQKTKIISVGDIVNKDQVQSRLKYGAQAVQIYSMFLTKGPLAVQQLLEQ